MIVLKQSSLCPNHDSKSYKTLKAIMLKYMNFHFTREMKLPGCSVVTKSLGWNSFTIQLYFTQSRPKVVQAYIQS